jgi:UDP-N-acetylmuramate-alanine ligase
LWITTVSLTGKAKSLASEVTAPIARAKISASTKGILTHVRSSTPAHAAAAAWACDTNLAALATGCVIVWINGTHGAGKTTTSALVQELIPDSRVFSPEKVAAQTPTRDPMIVGNNRQ